MRHGDVRFGRGSRSWHQFAGRKLLPDGRRHVDIGYQECQRDHAVYAHDRGIDHQYATHCEKEARFRFGAGQSGSRLQRGHGDRKVQRQETCHKRKGALYRCDFADALGDTRQGQHQDLHRSKGQTCIARQGGQRHGGKRRCGPPCGRRARRHQSPVPGLQRIRERAARWEYRCFRHLVVGTRAGRHRACRNAKSTIDPTDPKSVEGRDGQESCLCALSNQGQSLWRRRCE